MITTNRRAYRRTAGGIAIAAALALTGCGSEKTNATSSPLTTGNASAVRPATTAAAGGAATTAAAAATTAAPAATTAAAGMTDAPASASPAPTAAAASGGASADGSGSAATTTPARVSAPQPQQNPLRAGNVDDNEHFGDYLTYREKQRDLGVPFRELDPTDRTVVKVVGQDGVPFAGRKVSIRQGQSEVVSLTTTSDGTIRFHPKAYQGNQQESYTAVFDNTSIVLQPGQNQRMLMPKNEQSQQRTKVDVLFLLDTTGSMGDEIDQLKGTIRIVADRLTSLPSNPDLRLGLTKYRDIGDEYLTKTTDFTSDINAFSQTLNGATADGGGDTPEAVDEALASALSEPSWRSDSIQLIFLVADAGPHIDRQVQQPYTTSMRKAAARGIKIFPVASSNTDDAAEFVFRQLAEFTGARFVFLSYGATGAAVGPDTDIQKSDYQELALNDLIVRLVTEEVSARQGK
jgi:von Willebrand factor type A domain